MVQRLRLLLGVSILWLALSLLFDGFNTLVLPSLLIQRVGEARQATALGLLSFTGLLAGMLIQPVAGALSDRMRPVRGRWIFIGAGVGASLVVLFLLVQVHSLYGVIFAYLALQVAASVAQAGQQGLMPDLVPAYLRGSASGLKGFMDMAGAMLGFVLLGQILGSGRMGLALGVIGGALLAAYLLTVALTPEDRKVRGAGDRMHVDRLPTPDSYRLDRRKHRAFIGLVAARFLFLTGTYAVGRFLLYFVAGRLGLRADQAAEQAGNLLAGLALIAVLASPLAGWAADRIGRIPLMAAGAILSALGVLLLIPAASTGMMLVFGGLMSLGSAAFASANWAMTADLAPPEQAARFFGLANFGTAGAAAAAGLFGPVVDITNRITPGAGYPALFVLAALLFVASAITLRIVRAASEKPTSAAVDYPAQDLSTTSMS